MFVSSAELHCRLETAETALGEEERELFELVLLLKVDKQFPVEQFEATVSQSTAPSSAKPRRATKGGQWVLRTPLRIRTLVFLCSAWF